MTSTEAQSRSGPNARLHLGGMRTRPGGRRPGCRSAAPCQSGGSRRPPRGCRQGRRPGPRAPRSSRRSGPVEGSSPGCSPQGPPLEATRPDSRRDRFVPCQAKPRWAVGVEFVAIIPFAGHILSVDPKPGPVDIDAIAGQPNDPFDEDGGPIIRIDEDGDSRRATVSRRLADRPACPPRGDRLARWSASCCRSAR